jgi:hypothetical protein
MSKPTKFMELRITAASTIRGTRLWLDGHELRGVVEYKLHQAPSDATRLELTLIVESVNADAELLRKLLEDA